MQLFVLKIYTFVFHTKVNKFSMNEYKIIPPAIPSGGIYLFTTDSGIYYEVRFGRKQDNILMATIVFGVTNDEYAGEEYVETNRGEIYRVMATIVTIVKMFITEHPALISYEFTGLAREEEGEKKDTARIKLYNRYVKQIFDSSWNIELAGDKLVVTKLK